MAVIPNLAAPRLGIAALTDTYLRTRKLALFKILLNNIYCYFLQENLKEINLRLKITFCDYTLMSGKNRIVIKENEN
jgi:hypothetical protein